MIRAAGLLLGLSYGWLCSGLPQEWNQLLWETQTGLSHKREVECTGLLTGPGFPRANRQSITQHWTVERFSRVPPISGHTGNSPVQGVTSYGFYQRSVWLTAPPPSPATLPPLNNPSHVSYTVLHGALAVPSMLENAAVSLQRELCCFAFTRPYMRCR